MQLYSDITAGTAWWVVYVGAFLTTSCSEWASSERSSVVQWSNTNTGGSIFHDIKLQSRPQNGQPENRNQAQDGTVYYAMSTVSSMVASHVLCTSPFILAQLRSTGSLNPASHGKSTLQIRSATSSKRMASLQTLHRPRLRPSLRKSLRLAMSLALSLTRTTA